MQFFFFHFLSFFFLKVLFLGYGTQYWTTLGVDGFYSYYLTEEFIWTKILPNPLQPDVLIGLRFPITCNTDLCYKSVPIPL